MKLISAKAKLIVPLALNLILILEFFAAWLLFI